MRAEGLALTCSIALSKWRMHTSRLRRLLLLLLLLLLTLLVLAVAAARARCVSLATLASSHS